MLLLQQHTPSSPRVTLAYTTVPHSRNLSLRSCQPATRWSRAQGSSCVCAWRRCSVPAHCCAAQQWHRCRCCCPLAPSGISQLLTCLPRQVADVACGCAGGREHGARYGSSVRATTQTGSACGAGRPAQRCAGAFAYNACRSSSFPGHPPRRWCPPSSCLHLFSAAAFCRPHASAVPTSATSQRTQNIV